MVRSRQKHCLHDLHLFVLPVTSSTAVIAPSTSGMLAPVWGGRNTRGIS